MERSKLVLQMAKAFVGESMMDPIEPDETTRQRAEQALERIERYLGADVEEARDILARVMEDVS